jgi:hypothetical protein
MPVALTLHQLQVAPNSLTTVPLRRVGTLQFLFGIVSVQLSVFEKCTKFGTTVNKKNGLSSTNPHCHKPTSLNVGGSKWAKFHTKQYLSVPI